STPKQTIGHGSTRQAFEDTSVFSTPSTISDGDVQNQLSRLLDAHRLPDNNSNALHVVHLPKETMIEMHYGPFGLFTATSCSELCAYHNSYSHNGQNVYYAVIPDLSSSACKDHCGANDPATTVMLAASHEIAEAITDADVGQNDLAWYNTDL